METFSPDRDTSTTAQLKTLYQAASFSPSVYHDAADYQFINCHLIERSIAHCATLLSGRLLDVGCGSQPYNCYFSHVEAKVNCDFDDAKGNLDFTCSATEIPVDDNSFNSILCTEVLEHVPDPLKAMKEFHRILSPGGKLLLTTPMYWPAHELPHDYFRYPGHGLLHLTRTANLQPLALIPRGGIHAFLGQVTILGMQHFFRPRLARLFWNGIALKIDRWRASPRMTLGWTLLAQRS